MYYKQNVKIISITEETLVADVDIGKKTHYARAFNYRVIEFNIVNFFDDPEGYEVFVEWIEKTMRK